MQLENIPLLLEGEFTLCCNDQHPVGEDLSDLKTKKTTTTTKAI